MRNFLASFFLGLFLIAGCGTENVKLVPVVGVVKIDGEPAADIMVQFVPEIIDESVVAPTSQALTDQDGKFELFTLKNEKGAVEGTHRVSLIDIHEERVPQGEVATVPPRLDSKFATGAISVEVKSGVEITLDASGPN